MVNVSLIKRARAHWSSAAGQRNFGKRRSGWGPRNSKNRNGAHSFALLSLITKTMTLPLWFNYWKCIGLNWAEYIKCDRRRSSAGSRRPGYDRNACSLQFPPIVINHGYFRLRLIANLMSFLYLTLVWCHAVTTGRLPIGVTSLLR